MRVPESARGGARELRRFCDLAAALTPKPPGKALLAKAERLATRGGVELPERARRSLKVCRGFVQEQLRERGPEPPSEQQLQLARVVRFQVEGEHELPEDVQNDSAKCSRYIKELQYDREDSDVMFRPPAWMETEAKDLAERNGVEIPEGVLDDETLCKEFISDEKERIREQDDAGPTKRRLELAEALAKKAGVQLPEDARSSRELCEKFIREQQRTPPNELQLRVAEVLATKLGIEVPEDARQCHERCTAFISDCTRKVPKKA